MVGAPAAGRWGWLRAVGLMLATGLFSVVNPGVLVAIPFCLLVVFMPSKRFLALALAAVGGVFVAAGDADSGIWFAERGWALLLGGCFLALSLRWPGGRFLPKGLGAVFGSFLFMGLLLGVRPGDWAVLDWAVRSRMELAMSSFLQVLRMNLGSETISVALEARALETMAAQSLVFPALLGLASLAALGLSWWLYKRMARSTEEGIGPLKEFRFNDQLVWVLIMGVIALLVSSGAVARIGINAVVFIGALYALRGAAVVLMLTGGPSLFGWILFAVGFLFVAPLVIVGAVFIGLGDTWFDLRARRASPRSSA